MELKNKSRILYILKLLYENTDEENPMSTTDIIGKLADISIGAHRKTVGADIEQLEEFGIDIITIKSTQNKYFIGNREFELPEIKFLVDAVEASKFITHKKSAELIKKLSALTSQNQATELNRHIFTDKRVKPENEEIYYTVDSIHSAIAQNKQIEFKYYEYTQEKEKAYKNDGYIYKLSPYALSWNYDHYYVIGYCEKHGKISKFRVDRIAKIKITDAESVPMPEDFNGADYAKQIFDMYDGETKTVELKCTNDLMKVLVDRFGESINTVSLDSSCFKAIVDVSVSPTFFGWVFQFAGKISVLAPNEVKKDYVDMARKVVES